MTGRFLQQLRKLTKLHKSRGTIIVGASALGKSSEVPFLYMSVSTADSANDHTGMSTEIAPGVLTAVSTEFSTTVGAVSSEILIEVGPRPIAMIETKKEVQEQAQERQERDDVECRACLQRFAYEAGLLDMFQAWEPPWNGMGESIAQDFSRIANIEITPTDSCSKLICQFCHQRLLDACTFVVNVRINDRLLRQRAENPHEYTWPKPIQIDKNINSNVFNPAMDVEIKQEVLSEDETYANCEDAFKDGDVTESTENVFSNVEIKVEPEEIIKPSPYHIVVNGTITNDQYEQNSILVNGDHKPLEQDLQHIQVKQEPLSEEEEVEPPPDLPLECILCTKTFHSVTGLKAHVIAQHSYKTVKRKLQGGSSPDSERADKHVCVTCRRSFTTRTDLMVHETCHNKLSCYGCDHKCDTFQQLAQHRRRCRALLNNKPRHKTLHDVKRPHVETPLLQEILSQPADSSDQNETKDPVEVNSQIKLSENIMDIDMKVERLSDMSEDEFEQ